MEHLTSRANLSLLLSALTLFTTCTFYYYNIALTWQMHHATTFNEVGAQIRRWEPLLRRRRPRAQLHREYAAPEMMEALDTLYSFVEERQCVVAPERRMARGRRALTGGGPAAPSTSQLT